MTNFRIATIFYSSRYDRGWAAPASALVVGAYHILPPPPYYERSGKQPPGGGDGPLYYYGGSVFSNVKVVTIIWSKDVNSAPAALEG